MCVCSLVSTLFVLQATKAVQRPGNEASVCVCVCVCVSVCVCVRVGKLLSEPNKKIFRKLLDTPWLFTRHKSFVQMPAAVSGSLKTPLLVQEGEALRATRVGLEGPPPPRLGQLKGTAILQGENCTGCGQTI